MLKKFLATKKKQTNKRHKKSTFFFRDLQLITVLLLIRNSYTRCVWDFPFSTPSHFY